MGEQLSKVSCSNFFHPFPHLQRPAEGARGDPGTSRPQTCSRLLTAQREAPPWARVPGGKGGESKVPEIMPEMARGPTHLWALEGAWGWGGVAAPGQKSPGRLAPEP